MKVFTCSDNCCEYRTIYYNRRQNRFCDFKRGERMQKSGIFITTPFSLDNTENIGSVKILLVQSKGQFWGPPKGSLDPGESIVEAAIREVREETGLEFDEKSLGEVKIVKGSCYYFHLTMDEVTVDIQNTLEGNDANGIGWFRIDCLERLIKWGKIQINQHCNVLVKKILGVTLSQNLQNPKPVKISLVKI